LSILQIGEIIRDTYEVEKFLGQGAFAEVYRVSHQFMRQRQAMKVFKTPGTTLSDLEMGMGEARMLSELRHPNLMEVFDANVMEIQGRRYGYFTMNYMPGGTLETYWRSFGNRFMPVEEVVDVARQLCRGLSLAHSKTPAIVHRDIKPQNILVSYPETGIHVRLSDFGLAKAVNPLTLLASSRGTIGFKPPESFRNQDSCPADIWALGTTLYLLLTDNLPFPALGNRDLEDAHRFLRPLIPASSFNSAVDRALDTILFRCLASDPLDRYPHAMELLNDLDRWSPGADPLGSCLSDYGKTCTPAPTPAATREADAARLAEQAFEVAKDPTRLAEAAELMEEAIGKNPEFRDKYREHLRLWRRGVMHVAIGAFPERTKNRETPRNERGLPQ